MKQKNLHSIQLFRNRLKRIVPNYWFLTTVALLLLVFFPDVFQNDRTIDWPWITASYLFVPWMSQSGIGVPLLGLGWTLNYEMYFYFAFSLLLFFNRNTAILALAAIFFGSVFLGSVLGHSGPLTKMLTSWLLLEFLAGCFLGIVYKSGFRVPLWAAWAFVICSIVVLLISPFFRELDALSGFLRFVFFGIPALALVASGTLYETQKSSKWCFSWLYVVGGASYSLYLTHVFSLPFLSLVFGRLNIELPWSWSILIFVTFSIIVGVSFWLLFERPIQNLLRKRN